MSLVSGLVLAVLALQGPGSTSTRVHPRRLLVRVDPGLAAVSMETLHPELGLRELWNLPQIGWRALELPLGERDHAHALLRADPAVLEVRLDVAHRVADTPTVVPNDPLFPGQWGLSRIAAPLAWERELGDPGVVVAVIDTGVELAHPDLAANLWTNPGEIPGNGLDDDGNGYVDDVHGWDFAGLDCDPSDTNGHGTACAGIVAAVQGNALGLSGVAPGCRIAAIRAAEDATLFFASACVPALVYCADMGFTVLSMSYFSDEVVPAEHDALAYCAAHGVLAVAAAGNENSVLPAYPAAYPEAIAVGATLDTLDRRAFFTNWGTWVDVAAPGWSLTTTSLAGSYSLSFSGTSASTPLVAGIAALLASAAPLAGPSELRAAIEDSSLLLDQAPYGKWTRYGRVNASAALDRVLGITAGPAPARLSYAAPCGGTRRLWSESEIGRRDVGHVPVEIAGVGLEPPSQVRVLDGTQALEILAQDRHGVIVNRKGQGAGVLKLVRDGLAVQSFTWEPGPGLLYAATDACTEDTLGCQAYGAWRELHRQDGLVFTCTENVSGKIYCEFAVRGVHLQDFSRLTLEFGRDYDGLLAGAQEVIELYDWQSNSYPYGTWVTLSSTSAPTSFETCQAEAPGDVRRFLDPEGTLYLRLTVAAAGPSGLLSADFLRVRLR